MIIEGWISKTNINVEPGTYKLIRVTGDAILHKPSGETWLVAFVRHGRLTACGWPESQVLLTDCELKRKATPGAKFSLLLEMERMSRPDSRQIHASIFLENWAKREAV